MEDGFTRQVLICDHVSKPTRPRIEAAIQTRIAEALANIATLDDDTDEITATGVFGVHLKLVDVRIAATSGPRVDGGSDEYAYIALICDVWGRELV